MKKIIQFLFLLSFSVTVSAQVISETSKFDIILTPSDSHAGQIPKIIDTVFLNETLRLTDKIYTKISISDTSFIIRNIPPGKHWLLFSTQAYCINPIPILVCSKCDNQFQIYVSPKKKGNNCGVFEMVEISPHYVGGNKAMSKDFLQSLSKKEKKALKASEGFDIHFYLTKQGTISDLTFTPKDLTQNIKATIIKGLATMTDWGLAIRNGRIVDDEVTLNKKDLLNK